MLNRAMDMLLKSTSQQPLFIYHPDPHDNDMCARLVLEVSGYRNWYGEEPGVIYIYKAAWDGLIRQIQASDQKGYAPIQVKPTPWQVSKTLGIPDIRIIT